MLEAAKEKLKKEMELNKTDGYIQLMGQVLLDYLREVPSAADAILTNGKTIAKSFDALEAEAKKRPRVKNVVMLTPEEGIKVVLDYFGISSTSRPVMPDSKSTNDFDVKLEDLL